MVYLEYLWELHNILFYKITQLIVFSHISKSLVYFFYFKFICALKSENVLDIYA
jgi:hypothetical protein